jgi:hypothetical protein
MITFNGRPIIASTLRTLALAIFTVVVLHLTLASDARAGALPTQCAHQACGIDGACTSAMVNHYCCGSGSDCVTTSCLNACD